MHAAILVNRGFCAMRQRGRDALCALKGAPWALSAPKFGAVNAFRIVILGITPFLVTLATLVAGRGLGTTIKKSFGIEFPAQYLAFGASNVFGLPMPILVFAAVVLAAHVVFSRTQYVSAAHGAGGDHFPGCHG